MLDEAFIQKCREAFNTFDSDGSGTIDAHEMKQLLEAIGEHPSDEELFQFMADVDENGTGEIVFSEFLPAAFVALGGNSDKSGSIDNKKLHQVVCNEFGMTLNLEQILKEAGLNPGVNLSYGDFKILLS